MAKQAAAPRGDGGRFQPRAEAVAEAPKEAPAKAPPQSRGGQEPKVIAWDEHADRDFADEGTNGGPIKIEEGDRAQVIKWDDQGGTEGPGAAEDASGASEVALAAAAQAKAKEETATPNERKTLSPEQRRRALDALEGEKAKRSAETAARAAQERADAAEKRAAELEAAANTPVRERARKLPKAERDALMEELLLDKPDEDATAPPAKEDPAITALKLEVERLKKVEADRDAERQNARILEADQFVAEAVKNIDVPIVKIARDLIIDGQHIRTGYGLVVETAYQAWMDAGKKGSPQDYVEGAADVVEQWLASKRPELAELAKRPTARTETQTDGEPRPVAAARAIGRRTGARPDAKPTPLPRDKTDRDLQIKKEMGW